MKKTYVIPETLSIWVNTEKMIAASKGVYFNDDGTGIVNPSGEDATGPGMSRRRRRYQDDWDDEEEDY